MEQLGANKYETLLYSGDIFYILHFKTVLYLPSGSIGIGDMFLAVSGVFNNQTICSRKKNFFYKIDIPWYVFIICCMHN